MAERRTYRMSLKLPPAIGARLDAYIDAVTIKPTRTAVVEGALKKFLDEAGVRDPIDRRAEGETLETEAERIDW